MHTNEEASEIAPRRRRRHSDEFKAGLVAACSQPGVSIASVALANGVNANLLRRWMGGLQGVGAVDHDRTASATPAVTPAQAAFVALQMHGTSSLAEPELRIELKRGTTTVVVNWPFSAIAASAALRCPRLS